MLIYSLESHKLSTKVNKMSFVSIKKCAIKGHDADNLDLPSDDMNPCLIKNQIDTNDDDKQSTSSPEVEKTNGQFSFENIFLFKIFVNFVAQHHWDFGNKANMSMLDAGADGSNLMIGSSMTICDDSSGDNSADTNVEELEPTIQNLDLDQKFNDAESYLIESGEISSDGGGKLQKNITKYAAINLIEWFLYSVTAFDSVPGNAPVTMAIVNPVENTEV